MVGSEKQQKSKARLTFLHHQAEGQERMLVQSERGGRRRKGRVGERMGEGEKMEVCETWQCETRVTWQ